MVLRHLVQTPAFWIWWKAEREGRGGPTAERPPVVLSRDLGSLLLSAAEASPCSSELFGQSSATYFRCEPWRKDLIMLQPLICVQFSHDWVPHKPDLRV